MIIDISVGIDRDIHMWPGNLAPKIGRLSDMKNGEAHNETFLELNAHTGTHIDAPLHFVSDGRSIDQIDPGVFIGPAFVVELPDVKQITSKDLEKIKLPQGVDRLLFKTSNSLLWSNEDSVFTKNYVGITTDAATWLVNKKIKLVGIDYLSIATFNEAVEVHNVLLKDDIVILEGVDLSEVEEGTYKLICLPIKISGAEAAPARAILIK